MLRTRVLGSTRLLRTVEIILDEIASAGAKAGRLDGGGFRYRGVFDSKKTRGGNRQTSDN